MGRPNKFDGMMHEFCAKLGFCGGDADGVRADVCDFIPEAGPVTADQFARWILLAEGMNPEQDDDNWLPRLRAVFVRHMGADIADASELRPG